MLKAGPILIFSILSLWLADAHGATLVEAVVEVRPWYHTAQENHDVAIQLKTDGGVTMLSVENQSTNHVYVGHAFFQIDLSQNLTVSVIDDDMLWDDNFGSGNFSFLETEVLRELESQEFSTQSIDDGYIRLTLVKPESKMSLCFKHETSLKDAVECTKQYKSLEELREQLSYCEKKYSNDSVVSLCVAKPNLKY